MNRRTAASAPDPALRVVQPRVDRGPLAVEKPFIKVEVFKLLDLTQRERLHDLTIELGYDVLLVEGDVRYLVSCAPEK